MAADLLRQKRHGIAFAGTLSMPENAQFAVVELSRLVCLDRFVYPEVLMVAGKNLCRAPAGMVEQNEVLQQEILLFTDAPQHGFQLYAALLFFV